ncbi:MAG: alpha/beta hydrolase [Gammaproteobacteria bacterium]|nr:alpha/beta hydrolase [Gammaproteobacteria bacterium]MBU1600624.1 alpha/beta hydrolase [Gammaproteobacteria bacterium]MBU2435080.1 alpha/beta hydrolase [Gammaproteobacteria bacterium]MBU2448316.1 alpha/beta hydrolase [Gammaproteobacteria bacterium]
MKVGQGLFAKALRFFFDHFVLTKIGYSIDPFSAGRDEERVIPTAHGPVRALFHWPRERGEKLPLFLHIHGGGFIFGKPDHDAVFCRRIAENAGCLVVNVDYWRAPEHQFPIAYHQCYEALVWLVQNAAALGIDAERIAVGGHSAGGNLTAGVVAQAKENGGPQVCLQILDYPFTDAHSDPLAKKSRIAKPLINPGLAGLFNACYLPQAAQASLPQVSPLFASIDSLRGQPPALVITAENDLLRDEGDAYAAILIEAGVTVRHEVFPGVDHYFTHTGPKEPADAAWRLMEESLREAFSISVVKNGE